MISDRTIRRFLLSGEIQLEAPDGISDIQFQPASVDLRLDSVKIRHNWIMRLVRWSLDKIRAWRGLPPEPVSWTLKPGQFALACTIEVIGLGPKVAARVEGKSSLGRRGLQVHSAGFVDPGFTGQITLELVNLHHDTPIRLVSGMMICQLSFDLLDTPALRPYGHPELRSHYQGQTGVTGPRG